MQRRRHHSRCQRAVVAVEVAVLQLHIDHARQSRSIARRKAALVDCHAAHHLRAEHRHESFQVFRIIDRKAIDCNLVLVVVAAAHIDAGGAVAARLHSWQCLQCFQNVDLAERCRNRLYLAYRQLVGTHLRRAYAYFRRSVDCHVAQLVVVFKLYGDSSFSVGFDFYGLRFVTHITDV